MARDRTAVEAARHRKRRLRLLPAVVAAGLLLWPACGGDDSGAGDGDAGQGAPDGKTVVLKDIAFKPAELSVEVGDTVIWRFEDQGIPHNVVADDDSFKSDLKDSGTFEHTFEAAGEFSYQCTVHPGMKGSIRVG